MKNNNKQCQSIFLANKIIRKILLLMTIFLIITITSFGGLFASSDSVYIANASVLQNENNSPNYPTILNPYRYIDWETVGSYRAQLHVHTDRSDGKHSPAYNIARYQELGFHFLALTEHNRVTYPWSRFGHVPTPNEGGLFDGLTIQAVIGNELSRSHHAISLFSDFRARPLIHVESHATMRALSRHNSQGRAILAHPGRYVPNLRLLDFPLWPHNLNYYVGMFMSHQNLLGLEVFSQNDRHRNDRILWDRILNRTMPYRLVWAFAADDNHGEHFGFNKVTALLEEPTVPNLQKNLDMGAFTASSFGRFDPAILDTRHGAAGARWDYVPRLERVEVCDETGYITIIAANYTDIVWTTYNGIIAGTGNTLNYRGNPTLKRFVRVTMTNYIDGVLVATTLLQPFGLI